MSRARWIQDRHRAIDYSISIVRAAGPMPRGWAVMVTLFDVENRCVGYRFFYALSGSRAAAEGRMMDRARAWAVRTTTL